MGVYNIMIDSSIFTRSSIIQSEIQEPSEILKPN